MPATDDHLEAQAISATIDRSPILILNLYLPPASSCAPGYALSGATMDSLLDLLDGFVGDGGLERP